jgi:hypothetical protein
MAASEGLEPLSAVERVVPAAAQLNADAIQLASAGQLGDAVDRLQAARRLAPGDAVLTQNLQVMLYNWAVAALAASELDDARARLEQAAELGDRVEVLRALGLTYLRQGNDERAAATLEHVLHLAPTDTGALLALADVFLRRNRRPEAFDLLRRAKDAGAGGTELDQRLEQLSREVDAEWGFVQLQSPHFRVSFADDQDNRAVRLVLDALEEAYDVVGSKLNAYPDGQTPVVLYTQQDFHAITRTPDWAGAAFDGRIKMPVRGLTANDPSLARIARHEYAHSVVARLAGQACPVWLNEGLAVWAEEDEDGERAAWAERALARQELFPLDALSRSLTHLPAGRVEAAYAQSYLAVQTLIDRHGARKIPALLGALGRTGSMNDAFAATYPGDLPGFEQQLRRQLGG